MVVEKIIGVLGGVFLALILLGILGFIIGLIPVIGIILMGWNLFGITIYALFSLVVVILFAIFGYNLT